VGSKETPLRPVDLHFFPLAPPFVLGLFHLIGADLFNLGQIQGLGALVASIGGAGTFDGIFITSILAVLLALASWVPTPSILLHREPGLCRYIIHPGQDVHHAGRLGIRHHGPRSPITGRGMGWRQRYALRPAWLDFKRHRDTINRTPLGVLHPHDHLGRLREVSDIAY
jgi:hypothetical protein